MIKEVFEITKIESMKSKKGEPMKLITFRIGLSGGSTRTWIVESYKNARKWREVIRCGVGTVVGNLRMKNGLVNADSTPKILSRVK